MLAIQEQMPVLVAFYSKNPQIDYPPYMEAHLFRVVYPHTNNPALALAPVLLQVEPVLEQLQLPAITGHQPSFRPFF
jgi:hypothetical protein